jgi:hypothetical protein
VAEVNFPSWAKAVDLMYPRALKMTLKPRHILVSSFFLFSLKFLQNFKLYIFCILNFISDRLDIPLLLLYFVSVAKNFLQQIGLQLWTVVIKSSTR